MDESCGRRTIAPRDATVRAASARLAGSDFGARSLCPAQGTRGRGIRDASGNRRSGASGGIRSDGHRAGHRYPSRAGGNGAVPGAIGWRTDDRAPSVTAAGQGWRHVENLNGAGFIGSIPCDRPEAGLTEGLWRRSGSASCRNARLAETPAAFNHGSVLTTSCPPPQCPRRHCPGADPVRREKVRVMWLWSENPQMRAMSASGRREPTIRSLARSTLSRSSHW